MLVAKRVVDTLAVDPHVLHQILDRSSLVTARPENLHGFMEKRIAIELFLPGHSFCLGYLYTLSGTNSQESHEFKGNKQCSWRDAVEFTEQTHTKFTADFARYILEGRCIMLTITTKDETQ